MERTNISWTDSTFCGWWGCTKVSPGCQFCYAEALDKRFGGDHWGVGKPRKRTSPANWAKPLAWNKAAAASGKRHLVFCASMADWLDPEVPVSWLADLLALIAATPNLTWQLLTKRPELWRQRLNDIVEQVATSPYADNNPEFLAQDWLDGHAPANVWLGCTVEDQRRADERIPWLLSIPAKVRFLSMEPLVEAVVPQLDVTFNKGYCGACDVCGDREERIEVIDWVIVGGESGSKARPFNLGWARSIVEQCKVAEVAVFVKQMGNAPFETLLRTGAPDDGGDVFRLKFTTHHGADPSEWPEDLRVQEFPG